jgi:hypothetical protein
VKEWLRDFVAWLRDAVGGLSVWRIEFWLDDEG